MREQEHEEEEAEMTEEDEEEGGEGIVASLHNLNIETGRTEEEAAEGLEAVLWGASQEIEVEESKGRE